MEAFLIIFGIVALIILIFTVAFLFDRNRRLALEQVAEEMGLEFYSGGSEKLRNELSSFKLMNIGRRRKLTKLIQGQSDEVMISIFDYQYTVGGGKSSHSYRQTVAALQSNELAICDFTMRTENIMDKLGGMIGLKDIDFDSHPQFSKMFVLKGSHESAVRELFKPNVLSYFESKKGLSVEGQHGTILIYRPGKKVDPKEIKSFLSQAYEVYGIFADHL